MVTKKKRIPKLTKAQKVAARDAANEKRRLARAAKKESVSSGVHARSSSLVDKKAPASSPGGASDVPPAGVVRADGFTETTEFAPAVSIGSLKWIGRNMRRQADALIAAHSFNAPFSHFLESAALAVGAFAEGKVAACRGHMNAAERFARAAVQADGDGADSLAFYADVDTVDGEVVWVAPGSASGPGPDGAG